MEEARYHTCDDAGQRCQYHGEPHGAAADNKHGADRCAGSDGTIHGQVGDVKYLIGDVYTDCHDAPNKSLGNGSR